ncbi:MAG: dienelactone hydrolase family protein [Pegethrix bostrychoides GSE-TBD4-15B]|jgi:carboxymethylenebutenolidase|uniref:Dienelactone hydrolase family protein n=1 Tax=Pegethrix bostrychoides GSE-TBD4-15B TaxID=2839662 RepID=A0A951PF80_9CYAN|nr:dienelactone hydrolase family protein [Pegethrix bostrychoides GSE-TBD4-15B]
MGQDILDIGYLALPKNSNGMGVIVIQEWWGLVPHIKDVAERFAAAGYVTLAPDIYNGTTTKSPDEAQRLFMALNIEKAAQELESAIDCVLKHPSVKINKLGVVGFCMGGQLALLAATTSEHVGAVVDFYGVHPNVSPDFSRLTAPVLGLFGETDDFVPPATVLQLEAAIQQAGGSIESHSYPGAGHAFFNDSRPEAYRVDAATDAWQRVLTFLPQALAA